MNQFKTKKEKQMESRTESILGRIRCPNPKCIDSFLEVTNFAIGENLYECPVCKFSFTDNESHCSAKCSNCGQELGVLNDVPDGFVLGCSSCKSEIEMPFE